MKTYKVQTGDTLWGIAKKLLGDGNKYKEIMKANGKTDTKIFPGEVLKISTTNYEDLGKAFEKALNEVDNLSSVQNLYKLMGE